MPFYKPCPPKKRKSCWLFKTKQKRRRMMMRIFKAEDCLDVSTSCYPIYCPLSSSLNWKKHNVFADENLKWKTERHRNHWRRILLRFFFFSSADVSSCRTVVSLHPYSTTLINSAVCFITMLFTFTCLLLAFRRMYFIHATYMFIFYLFITCHASMAYSYINLSVDLAVSLASL